MLVQSLSVSGHLPCEAGCSCWLCWNVCPVTSKQTALHAKHQSLVCFMRTLSTTLGFSANSLKKGHVYAHNKHPREAVCSPDTPASFLWLLREAVVGLTGTFPKFSEILGTKPGYWQEIKATHGGNCICFHLMSKLSLCNEPWKRLNINNLSFPEVPAPLLPNHLGDIKILFSISL